MSTPDVLRQRPSYSSSVQAHSPSLSASSWSISSDEPGAAESSGNAIVQARAARHRQVVQRAPSPYSNPSAGRFTIDPDCAQVCMALSRIWKPSPPGKVTETNAVSAEELDLIGRCASRFGSTLQVSAARLMGTPGGSTLFGSATDWIFDIPAVVAIAVLPTDVQAGRSGRVHLVSLLRREPLALVGVTLPGREPRAFEAERMSTPVGSTLIVFQRSAGAKNALSGGTGPVPPKPIERKFESEKKSAN